MYEVGPHYGFYGVVFYQKFRLLPLSKNTSKVLIKADMGAKNGPSMKDSKLKNKTDSCNTIQ